MCFRPQVRGETPTQLGPLGVFPLRHLRTETDPVSETLCFLVSRIQEVGQSKKSSNSECYTPSSTSTDLVRVEILTAVSVESSVSCTVTSCCSENAECLPPESY
jgi:hypothetical protein